MDVLLKGKKRSRKETVASRILTRKYKLTEQHDKKHKTSMKTNVTLKKTILKKTTISRKASSKINEKKKGRSAASKRSKVSLKKPKTQTHSTSCQKKINRIALRSTKDKAVNKPSAAFNYSQQEAKHTGMSDSPTDRYESSKLQSQDSVGKRRIILDIKPTVSGMSSYTISDSVETQNWITGMAVTRDGGKILIDRSYRKVKLFSSDMRALSSLALPAHPWDIAIYKATEAIVTTGHQIYFIDFSNDSLSIRHTFRTSFRVYGVTVSHSNIYATVVTGFQSVRVLDEDGHVLWSIFIDAKGKDLFKDPLYITSFTINTAIRLVVTDSEAETITLLDGDTGDVKAIHHVTMNGISGVTSDLYNNIYVCYSQSNVITVLPSDLSKEEPFLTSKYQQVYKGASMYDLNIHPQSITFDGKFNQLIISSDSTGDTRNKIQIYQLE